MVQLQRLTRARPSEICAIRPADINRTSEVWEYIPVSHKTEHRDRIGAIFIGAKGQEILLPYLLCAAESYCFSPREAELNRRAGVVTLHSSPARLDLRHARRADVANQE